MSVVVARYCSAAVSSQDNTLSHHVWSLPSLLAFSLLACLFACFVRYSNADTVTVSTAWTATQASIGTLGGNIDAATFDVGNIGHLSVQQLGPEAPATEVVLTANLDANGVEVFNVGQIDATTVAFDNALDRVRARSSKSSLHLSRL